MDGFDATDPDEFPPLADTQEAAAPHVDDPRLESLLARVLESDAEPDDSLLPVGDGPFDAVEGEEAGGWPGHHPDPDGAAGPFADAGTAPPDAPIADRAETYDWSEGELDVEKGASLHDHGDHGDPGDSPADDHDDLDFDGD
jgi:hypothetical protein